MSLPKARKTDLLTTKLEDEEVVVYDPETKQAHSLNRTAVAVWNHCDGQTSIGELQRLVSAQIGSPISEAGVWLALRKLESAHLLTDKIGTEPLTRRQLLRDAGRVGTAAIVITPIVLTSNILPAAAACSTCGVMAGTTQVCACGTQLINGARQTPKVCVNAATSSTNSCVTTTDCTPFNVAAICVAFDGVGNCHVPCTGTFLPPNPCGNCGP